MNTKKTPTILIYIKDIFDQVKIESACKRENLKSKIGPLENILAYDYVIANLEEEGVLEELKKNPKKFICFCSHMKLDLINEAKKIGATIYPRSIFFPQLVTIIKKLELKNN